ncbi:MAG: hypothetical protein JW941_12405 [Candidatus Coatesbacteria bacterium]|nr:hypothetical protein [Candidatus Coatesbacteria bacterium]
MKAVKGVYENGTVTFVERPKSKEPADVIVIFNEEADVKEGQSDVQADALLNKLDAIADSIEGDFDSAHDIREIRMQRTDSP